MAAGCAVALGGPCPGAEEKKAGAAGTWKWEFMNNDQTLKFTLKVKQDGDKLTGVLLGPREGMERKVEEGKVKDGEVSFTVTREQDGNKFTVKYKGKLSGDTIKGKAAVDFGGETREFDWEAKRAKGEK
jgi:hypothetical protein